MSPKNLTRQPTRNHDYLPDSGAFGSKLAKFIQLAFFVTASVLVLFFRQTPAIGTLSITFVAIFLEALPFMLVGSMIGGFIEIFVSRDALTRLLPKATWRSILIAAAVGFILPICECAIVPVVRRLFNKGLQLGSGIAFLLGGPIVNPLVGISTAVAYGYDWSIALTRMVIGYLVAVTIGLLVELLFNKQPVLADGVLDNPTQCRSRHPHQQDNQPLNFSGKVALALQHAAADFLDIGRFLIFGAFIAGILQTVIARSEMSLFAGSPVFSILAMMALAIILNLCSEADAFVAASFRTVLPITAQMAFMMLGPMLDIKLVLMYFRIFRRRLIIALAAMTFSIVFLTMMAMLWSIG